MFTIPDGRSQFYQWDANQRLKCSGLTAGTEIHFATCVGCGRRCDARSDVALVMDSYADGGAVYVDVPNQLLQSGCELTVYAYVASGDETHTSHMQTFKVRPRPQPDSYVYEETDVKTWAALDARILQLEQELEGLVGLDPLLEGQDVAFSTGENGNYAAALTVDFVFTPGAEYKVFWDDEEFSCTAYSDDGVGMLGNHSLVDASGADTVEPFVMAATGGALMINTADSSGAHRVAIYQLPGDSSVVIDATLTQEGQAADAAAVGAQFNLAYAEFQAKYDALAEQVDAADDASCACFEELMAETKLNFEYVVDLNDDGSIAHIYPIHRYEETPASIVPALTTGKAYIVTIDGNKYDCVASVGSHNGVEVVQMGDFSANTPFVIKFAVDGSLGFISVSSNYHSGEHVSGDIDNLPVYYSHTVSIRTTKLTGLPDVTTEDNDKLMQVVGGIWTPVTIGDSAIGKYIDEYINSALEGEY